MENLKDEAKRYIEARVEWYRGYQDEHIQSACFAQIRFAVCLKLISWPEAAEYCQQIGLEKAASTYGKYAEIDAAVNAME